MECWHQVYLRGVDLPGTMSYSPQYHTKTKPCNISFDIMADEDRPRHWAKELVGLGRKEACFQYDVPKGSEGSFSADFLLIIVLFLF